ncbi:hypothetical protein I8D64_09875 [Brachybacterium sp. MASK1Z-5]|uniref:Uncharacterized protein n=1 Tax=Brachybacterium halotolerans TaxID=2795215 RepID=A0ABS1BAM4_9MICO|nr:hypothetical protein [Brachybacterium halotolerans]MBK0331711.1 hypothetical protein [Brachybacterium halotolerans]
MSRPQPMPSEHETWTARDAILLRTAQIIYAVEHDEFHVVDGLPVEFAVAGTYPDNRIVLAAPSALHSYQALGDGTYQQDSSMFFTTGGLGLAMTAGHLAGQAMGNSRRRAAAAEAATERWRHIDGGMAYVNQYGIYLATPTDILPWPWDAIVSAKMVNRRQFAMIGDSSDRGRVRYIFESDAAELMFAFWAMVRQPQHPQLAQRVWLLPEFLEKYRRMWGANAFDFWADGAGRHLES